MEMIWDELVNPMECKLMKEPPKADGSLYQEKIDGGRTLIEATKDLSIFMWSSGHHNRAYRYPEIDRALREVIKANNLKQVVFDGEMAVRIDGVWNYEHGFLARQTDTPFRIRYLSERMPATYNIFHILQIDGESMKYYKLSEIAEMLSKIRIPDSAKPFIQILPFHDNPDTVLNIPNTEGVVWKNPDSIYEDSGEGKRKRSGSWKKWRYYIDKKVKVIDLEVTKGGVTVTVIDDDGQDYRVAINGKHGHDAEERWEEGEFYIEMKMKKPVYEGERRFPTFKRFVGE